MKEFGRDHKTWDRFNKHGFGKYNSLLLQICERLNMCSINDMFLYKNKYKTTWMHTGSKQMAVYKSNLQVWKNLYQTTGRLI